MRTEERSKGIADESTSRRSGSMKTPAGSRQAAAPLYPGVKTLDDWAAWMRARGRYQWDSEE